MSPRTDISTAFIKKKIKKKVAKYVCLSKNLVDIIDLPSEMLKRIVLIGKERKSSTKWLYFLLHL